jgi:CIC family chloride channel protein
VSILAGALFTAEILIGVITLPIVLPALVCAGIATVTAWVYLPTQAVYPDVPDYPLTLRRWCGRCWQVR